MEETIVRFDIRISMKYICIYKKVSNFVDDQSLNHICPYQAHFVLKLYDMQFKGL